MKFHSPYQFINIRPAKAKVSYKIEDKKKLIESEYVRHDYWAEDGLTGTIQCKLTTKTPLVIGAKQIKGTNKQAGTVSSYKHPDGSIALPANSLRGMISSLAENLSQSSLRVLASREDTQYTVRKTPREALKELGMLVKKEDGYYIIPLPDTKKIGDYKNKNKNNEDVLFIKGHKSYQHSDNLQFVCAEIKGYYANHLEELPDGQECPVNKKKGILYIRGNHFDSKKYEAFIPIDNIEIDNNDHLIPVATKSIKQLELNLRRYQDKAKPQNALPVGYHRNWVNKNVELLKSGDLIYYKKERNNEVSDLSYSQTWRRKVSSDLYHAIEKEVGKNALPWNKNRQQLTQAEALFGVVETDFKEEQSARNLASRVSFCDATPENTITLDKQHVFLKILDSPKPPSPSMYFQSNDENGEPISKQQLDLTVHKPNGRKHYLPHSLEHKLHSVTDPERNDWQTHYNEEGDNYPTDGNQNENWQQYLKVTPIPKEIEFTFDINFENLNEAELGLLLTTLEPAEAGTKFLHKLGLGKPLGLGEVTLKISSVETNNKSDNYTFDKLSSPLATKTLTKEKIQEAKNKALNSEYIDEETLKELRILYNPDNIKHPVCYPFSSPDNQQAGEEGKGFNWFVINDALSGNNGVKQCISPISTDTPIEPAINVLSGFDNYLLIQVPKLNDKYLNTGEKKRLKEEIEKRVKYAEVYKDNILIFKEDTKESMQNLLDNNPHTFKLFKNDISISFTRPRN